MIEQKITLNLLHGNSPFSGMQLQKIIQKMLIHEMNVGDILQQWPKDQICTSYNC